MGLNSEGLHRVQVRALLGLAEPVLSLDLDVIEAVSELETFDLGALRVGRAVRDQREKHALSLQGVDHRMSIGEQMHLLLTILGKPVRQRMRDVSGRNRPPCCREF